MQPFDGGLEGELDSSPPSTKWETPDIGTRMRVKAHSAHPLPTARTGLVERTSHLPNRTRTEPRTEFNHEPDYAAHFVVRLPHKSSPPSAAKKNMTFYINFRRESDLTYINFQFFQNPKSEPNLEPKLSEPNLDLCRTSNPRSWPQQRAVVVGTISSNSTRH